ncbi:SH3 domain-containing protein [Sphingomonas sp.]|uniref:SH3 domain-containing protein n=1 Tax=Sphingomonas sp. TaxID=28214 RepID=UPI003AFFA858
MAALLSIAMRRQTDEPVTAPATQAASYPPPTLFVTPARVNCRAGASTRTPVLAQLVAGTAMVMGNEGSWRHVAHDGRERWIAADLLTTVMPQKTAAATFAIGPADMSPPLHRRSIASSTVVGDCPCRTGGICIGPRGGRYCITPGGHKRYK